MLCFFALTKGAWVGIGIGIFAIIIIVAAVIVNRRDKIKARRKQAGITEEKDVRYSSSAEVSKHDDTPKAAFVQGDLVASRNVTLTAGKDLKVGKYTVLTADGSDSFNIRVNGLVREIKHGDVLILGEGDTFCPVSHTVVLR